MYMYVGRYTSAAVQRYQQQEVRVCIIHMILYIEVKIQVIYP